MRTKIKVGRKEVIIEGTDLILDNGACYQILRQNNVGSYYLYNNLSKNLFRELRTLGGVFTSEGLRLQAFQNYHSECCTYWKFDIEHMVHRLGFEEINE